MNRFHKLLVLAISCVAVAQNVAEKPDYKLLNAIASCSTVECLRSQEKQVHNNVEGTVLYAKWLLLDPSSKTAAQGLLQHMPRTEDEAVDLMTLADWHEGTTTSVEQMQRLDVIHENGLSFSHPLSNIFPNIFPPISATVASPSSICTPITPALNAKSVRET